MSVNCYISGCVLPCLFYAEYGSIQSCYWHKSDIHKKHNGVCRIEACISKISQEGKCRYHRNMTRRRKKTTECIICKNKALYNFNYQRLCLKHYKESLILCNKSGIYFNFQKPQSRKCAEPNCRSKKVIIEYSGKYYCRPHILDKETERGKLKGAMATNEKRKKGRIEYCDSSSEEKCIIEELYDSPELSEHLQDDELYAPKKIKPEPELKAEPGPSKPEIPQNEAKDTEYFDPKENYDIITACGIDLFAPPENLCFHEGCLNKVSESQYCNFHSWIDAAEYRILGQARI